MKEGRTPEYPEKTPGDELQKMPHTKSPKIQDAKMLGVVKNVTWRQGITNEVLYAGLPRISTLASAVIARGVVRDLVLLE